ncbi:S49 family peptidase [Paraburkholderia sediminicola]|uniref:S49 family peptidase n=1 Tax=Paraburkholderia sediminicola TaxID=458836 RepID=UPI0038BDA13B
MQHDIESLSGPSAIWAIEPSRLPFVIALLSQSTWPDATPQARVGAATTTAARRQQAGSGAMIAVLPLYGIALQRTDAIGELLGLVSLQRFTQAFRSVVADDSVGGVLIDIDSPGGSVYGVQELADEIYRARSQKPIVAIANSLAASAAYWIGSSAGEFYVTPGGETGSIGVVAAHQDLSQALDRQGIKTTLVSAGRHKTEGNPFEPLGAEARRHVQTRVDAYYSAFVNSVARNRGVDVATVRNGMGQGRVLSAQAAKAANMVDDVATFDAVMRKLTQRAGEGEAANRLRAVDGLARPPANARVAAHAAARLRLIDLLSA